MLGHRTTFALDGIKRKANVHVKLGHAGKNLLHLLNGKILPFYYWWSTYEQSGHNDTDCDNTREMKTS